MTNPYDIVEIEQRTPEWEEWRWSGLGASDASTVMQENRFKSAERLFRERLERRTPERNAAMREGTILEGPATKAYCDYVGVAVVPVCLRSTRYPYMNASVDGINFEKRKIVEVKCGQSAWRNTKRFGVPAYYYGQLQHLLAVTGFEEIDFWCWRPESGGILRTVARDQNYIDRLAIAVRAFFERLEQAGWRSA